MREKQTTVFILILLILSFLINLRFNNSGKNQITGFFIKERGINEFKDNISIKAYFCPEDKCIDKIINSINRTDKAPTCYFFEEDLPGLLNILRYKKGTLYIDFRSKTPDESFIHRIKLSKGLMHMKFCVFGNKTIMGSYNPTFRGNYYDNNNILILNSKKLASVFNDEIKSNFTDKNEGIVRIIDSKNNITIMNCFSQTSDCRSLIKNELGKAKENIYFMTFSFTDKNIAGEIIKKGREGVNVEGVVESKFYKLLPDELKSITLKDKNPYNMHNKVFIIDNKTVITGSYNPSYNAKYNNWENLIIIKDRKTAQRFADEYFSIKNYKRTILNNSCIRIKSVLPNPKGNDNGKETISIKNNCNTTINLNYFFIKTKNWNEMLNGSIKIGKIKNITTKQRLTNSYDYVELFNYSNMLDNISWENAKEGEVIS